MPATITRGYTFGSTELVTNTKLHTLVDSATISGIDTTNFASGIGIVVRSTSTPTATDAIWVDTNFAPPLVRIYDGSSKWNPVGSYGLFTNKSAAQRIAGDVVIVDTTTDSSFTTTTTAGDESVLGIVMETVAQNAVGVVALPGATVSITVDGATTRGQYLKASGTATKATPVTIATQGVFAIALTASATSVTALLTGVSHGISSGTIAQIVETKYTNVFQVDSSSIPADDSIPRWDEGFAMSVLDVTITPKSATNTLLIEFGWFTYTAGLSGSIITLFDTPTQASDPAIATWSEIQAGSLSYGSYGHSYYFGPAGSTSTKTFKVRWGQAGTVYINNAGQQTTRGFGGTAYSFMRVTEYSL